MRLANPLLRAVKISSLRGPRFLRGAAIQLLYLLCTSLAFALPEDSKKTMVITSDTSIYNYKTGYTIFEGHVKVDQGTTHLTAARLTTKSNASRQIEEAIATSTDELAHYWTLPKIGDPEIHAEAKVIKLYPVQSNVSLERNVILSRGVDTFHGELIIYNRNDQTILVPAKQNARAVLTFNPDKK